jgi:hypothetical protein
MQAQASIEQVESRDYTYLKLDLYSNKCAHLHQLSKEDNRFCLRNLIQKTKKRAQYLKNHKF